MSVANGHRDVFLRFRSKPTGEWRCDPRLRPMLIADAEERESNMTAVAVGILADVYRVGVPANGPVRKTTPSGTANEMLLNLPIALYRKIDLARARHGRSSVQDEIVVALSEHYSLELPA